MSIRERKYGFGRRLRNRLEAGVFQLLVWIVPRLSWKSAMGLARFIGGFGHRLCSEDRRVADANVRIALGETVSDDQRARLVRTAFNTMACSLMGLLWGSKAKPEQLRRLVECEPESYQVLRDLLASKRNLVLMMPHMSQWELAGLAFPLEFAPVTGIAEPGVNPHIDDMITDARRSSGNRFVAPRHAMIGMVRDCLRGKIVVVACDVNARRGRGGGIWTDFFGLPVYTSVASAELAIKSRGVLCCCVLRTLPGDRLHMSFPKIIDYTEADSPDHDTRVRQLSEKTLAFYEDVFRQYPEEFLWTYKRWKRRPTSEQGGYPFYSKFDALEIEEKPLAT